MSDENDIKRAFSESEKEDLYDTSREDTIRGMWASTFRGRLCWMVVVAWIYMLGWTAVAVWSAVQFFRAAEVKEWILFATIFLTTVLFATLTKMWYWMLINRNSVKREVKRLELRVAELTQQLERE